MTGTSGWRSREMGDAALERAELLRLAARALGEEDQDVAAAKRRVRSGEQVVVRAVRRRAIGDDADDVGWRTRPARRLRRK